MRWIGLENFHITMKFLGRVSGEQVEPIEAAMSKVATVFSIALGGLGTSPELRRLKQDPEWALSECGFESKARTFHPHITHARAKEMGSAGKFRGLDKPLVELDVSGKLKVDGINLIRSQLSKNGARYSVFSGAKLASASVG